MGVTLGRGKKLRKGPEHNKRNRISFERRYHMKRSEWTQLKKELRKKGRGFEIEAIRLRAQRVRI